MMHPYTLNPALDLVLERTIDVPPALVWKAWTTPELMVQWFTPAPWKTVSCEVDLRPGGIFKTVMESPEGQRMDHDPGCILEVVHERKLVWTSALGPGYRPSKTPESPLAFFFTAIISIEAHGTGSRYTATVIHTDEAGAARHREMGFHEGWGSALDQLVALMHKA